MKVQQNKEGIKLHRTYQLLVYVEDFFFTGRTHAYYKENPMSVVARKEVCLKVNVEKN